MTLHPERVLLLFGLYQSCSGWDHRMPPGRRPGNKNSLVWKFLCCGWSLIHTFSKTRLKIWKGGKKSMRIQKYRIYLSTVSFALAGKTILAGFGLNLIRHHRRGSSQILETQFMRFAYKIQKVCIDWDLQTAAGGSGSKAFWNQWLMITRLHELQITDNRNSIFERLLLQARKP